MPTLSFSEQSLGTVNPIFQFDDFSVYTSGLIRTDSANPTSPVLAGSSDFSSPIVVYFSEMVESIAFDAKTGDFYRDGFPTGHKSSVFFQCPLRQK